MIHEEICTYEVCKLAKEKGFPQLSGNAVYAWDGLRKIHSLCNESIWESDEYCLEDLFEAPTQSLLSRWLRERKGYYVYPYYDNNEYQWTYSIREKTGDMWILLVGETPYFLEYEEAMEAGLKYVLENLV
jgi:hypothetical protein